MFGWLFGRKKPQSLTAVVQETQVKGNRNRVVQTTNVVNQRGAKSKGDIVGGNKYSTYTPGYDPTMDMLNPLNPLSPISPLNSMNQPETEHRVHTHSSTHTADSGSSHSHSHSHDTSSSWHSHDSSSSSSYDSGSSYSSSSD